jgi:protease IV
LKGAFVKTIIQYAKLAIFGLILLHIGPGILKNFKEHYVDSSTLKTKVGRITLDAVITDSTEYNKNLKKFFKDPEIKAILLKIDCPGGVTGSCEAIFSEIQELKKKYPKPIITLTETICASGGYYIACATDCIIAARSTLIGGVGTTFTTLFNFKELMDQWHVKAHVIAAGSYKDATNQFSVTTPEQLAMLQDIANDSYHQFASDVAKARKISLQQINQWAEGKIFTGNQALALHMIDMTGSYSHAVEKLKTIAPIEGSIEWVDPVKKTGLLNSVLGLESTTIIGSLTNQVCQTIEQRYQAKLAS